MNNMEIWNKVKQPPKTALKAIQAGRLKGKSDINPQWRYEAITELFGPCGIGWTYTIEKLWTEPGLDGQVFAFAQISFYHLVSSEEVERPTDIVGVTTLVYQPRWSDPIPGIGGSMLLTKESSGIHHNDEAYKMAVTDALSVALKMIGVGADVYQGFYDGSKYSNGTPTTPTAPASSIDTLKDKLKGDTKIGPGIPPNNPGITAEQWADLQARCKAIGRNPLLKVYGVTKGGDLPASAYAEQIVELN
jgi:hypothetical protein